MVVGTHVFFACIILVALLYWGAILMQVVFYFGFLLLGAYVCSLFYVGYVATILILYNAMFVRVLAYLINAINLDILAVNKWGFVWLFQL